MTTPAPFASPGDSSPLLSIAIPTCQRYRWLSQSLEILLKEMSTVPTGQVELLVSENAGKDDSWALLQELASRHPALRIHRNVSNIGAESNFYQLPDMARGRYLWMLGDDDFLEPGALARILQLLAREPDFIALNVSLCDEEMRSAGKPFWQLEGERRVSSLDECMVYVPHFAMGFISCWIARRELFNVVDRATYDRFKTWGLSLMVDRYMTVARSRNGIVTAQPLLRSRKPPPQEYSQTFDYFEWFFEGSAQILNHLVSTGLISPSVVGQRKGWLLQHTAIKRILFERSVGVLKRRRVAEILAQHYRGQWQYWLLCLPALFVPGLGLAVRLVRHR